MQTGIIRQIFDYLYLKSIQQTFYLLSRDRTVDTFS